MTLQSRRNDMTIQMLVSGVQLNNATVAQTMGLEADSIIINQTDVNAYEEYEYSGHKIQCYSFAERGVGLSRNNALLRATADIIVFSDEDIVYEKGYIDKILRAYEQYPDADMLLFNIDVVEDRATYHTDSLTRVRPWKCGRYPTYSFTCRRESIHRNNITFNLLFGGGARYSNGEDSLFIKECLKKGLKVYALPVTLGKEIPRPSTWFNGFTDKFLYDRGVLYRFLYGCMAIPMAFVFLYRKRKGMLKDVPMSRGWKLMNKGIKGAYNNADLYPYGSHNDIDGRTDKTN